MCICITIYNNIINNIDITFILFLALLYHIIVYIYIYIIYNYIIVKRKSKLKQIIYLYNYIVRHTYIAICDNMTNNISNYIQHIKF